MDERLEAGRHHLGNGERAVREGYPDDARMYFEAALLQFRGPELRLGEAHALRGLAQVAAMVGDTHEAEEHARAAAEGYRALTRQLEVIDPTGLSEGMRAQARSGEAAALVLLAEILVRRGEREEARKALAHARVLGKQLGQFDAVAGVWNMLARLAMREGRYADAEDSVVRALDMFRETGNLPGQIGTLLLASELERLEGNLDRAAELLADAGPLAREIGNPMYEGRVMAAQAALALQRNDLDAARSFYELALPLIRAAGDQEMEGFTLLGLGEVESRAGTGAALDYLVDGARILGSLDHRHGLGGALLRIAEHGLRIGEAELALVGAEGARRLLASTDPVRGVGQAGRLLVKALAALQAWKAVLLVARWRVDVAGRLQPTARAVYDFYAQRLPAEWRAEVEAMGPERRTRATLRVVGERLTAILDSIGVAPRALSEIRGAVSVVEALAMRLPRPTADTADASTETGPIPIPEDDEDTEVHTFSVLGLGGDDEEAVLAEVEDPTEFRDRRAPTVPAPAAAEQDLVLFTDDTAHGMTASGEDDVVLVAFDDESEIIALEADSEDESSR